ncbi:MAG: DUF6165 family protein [Pseudomonadota bacterium]|nr:DUF6165 family protein [Pseudomonadota bacterium]
MKTPIFVEVAPGELIDKITILEIKLKHIKDEEKLVNVRLELETLVKARDLSISPTDALDSLGAELKSANEALWKIEDKIRESERKKEFNSDFVRLARSVYITNDKRAALKREINELLGSSLIEEKSYSSY